MPGFWERPCFWGAQTRQALRDAAHAEADAEHREALALASEQRQEDAARSADHLLELLRQNTQLTELTKTLTERVEALTVEMHERFLQKGVRQVGADFAAATPLPGLDPLRGSSP